MTRKIALCLVSAVMASLFVGGFAFGQEAPTGETLPGVGEVLTNEQGVRYIPGELVVAGDDSVEVVKVKERSFGALKEKAKALKEDRYKGKAVDLNMVYEAQVAPNDPLFDDQYHLRQIGAPGAWNDEKGAGVRACVVDTGWDSGQSDLDAKVVAERDVVNNDGTANDSTDPRYAHGTLTAGALAAETDNANLVAGVGWDSKLAVAKVATATDTFTTAWVKQGLNWCETVGGVTVISMSFGGPSFNDVINAEIQEQYNAGRTLVASVGNEGALTNSVYPAAYNGVIGVGASDPNGTIAGYSNRGDIVDIVAPGTDIRTTGINDGSVVVSGTSLSAPQVAGAAALLRAKGLTRDQTQARLFRYAEDRGPVGKDRDWGYGFLNVRCAVTPTATGC